MSINRVFNSIDKESMYWVLLASNENIGAKTIFKLKKIYGTITNLFKRKDINRYESMYFSKRVKTEIDKVINSYKLDDAINRLKKYNIIPIIYNTPQYPKLLLEIPDPPAVLFVRGNDKCLNNISLSVVGSRKYTIYGKLVVQDIVHKIASSGLCIVSGMALGIDTLAHKATVDAGGVTIGVLANGLDRIYPASNRALSEEIIQRGGAIISEYFPGILPYKSNFPLRNRIIAGMSLGTLVIEAAQKSGTLLTAKAALDYNRDLFAVPGSIYGKNSEGTNNLIKYGAKLINNYNDVLEELNIDRRIGENIVKKTIPPNLEESKIIKYLDKNESMHIDILAKKSSIKISILSSKLVLMEMKGMVKNVGANYYISL
jgi:DNA processing protein